MKIILNPKSPNSTQIPFVVSRPICLHRLWGFNLRMAVKRASSSQHFYSSHTKHERRDSTTMRDSTMMDQGRSEFLCKCGVQWVEMTSWTKDNPGRRFRNCHVTTVRILILNVWLKLIKILFWVVWIFGYLGLSSQRYPW